MARISGKIILVTVIFCILTIHVFCAEPLITLRTLDKNGNILSQAAAGIPFILEIAVHDADHKEPPTVQGLTHEMILKEQVHTSISLNNNQQRHSKKYLYTLLIDQPGTYLFGPATVELSRGTINSQKLSVVVGAKPIIAYDEPVLFEVIPSKIEAFVGEKITYIIRLSYDYSEPITPHALELLSGENLKFIEPKGPLKTSYERNGKRYGCFEWHGYFYAQNAGKQIIQPLKAQYTQDNTRNRSGWTSFFDPFGIHEKKIITSLAVTLAIKKLPETNKKIHAIGSFDRYLLSINKTRVKQGDAFVLTTQLEGKGNFSEIETPSLELPTGCKWYPSSTIIKDNGVFEIKKFEFVVQTIDAGLCHIPSQEFTFFDPDSGIYRTLYTEPAVIMVQENKFEQHIADVTHRIDQQQTTETISKGQRTWLAVDALHESIKKFSISLVVFIILLLLPVAYGLLIYIIALRSRYLHSDSVLRKYALKKAFQQLKILEKNGDANQLYSLFVQLFGLSEENLIESYLRSLQMSEIQLKEWRDFWQMLVQLNFDTSAISIYEKQKLLRDAHGWLILFEKLFSRSFNRKHVTRFSLCIITCLMVNITASEENEYKKIKELRERQAYATYSEFEKIEQEISEIKQQRENAKIADDSFLFMLRRFAHILPRSIWQILFLSLWYSIFLMLFSKHLNYYKRYLIMYCLLLCATAVFVIPDYYRGLHKHAVVFQEKIPVYMGPSNDTPIRFYANYLDEMVIAKKMGDWKLIEVNNQTGWVCEGIEEFYAS